MDVLDESVVANQIKKFHSFDLVFSGLGLDFLFGSGFLIVFIPFFLEFLLAHKFVIFNTDVGSVNGRVSLNLYFLVDFTDIPFKSFFIKVRDVGGN